MIKANCLLRFIDYEGNGAEWEAHWACHYAELFQPFEERPSDSLVPPPIGIIFVNDEFIEYIPRSGFEDAQPSIHLEQHHGVVFSPAFCPFCVFDEAHPFSRRLAQ